MNENLADNIVWPRPMLSKTRGSTDNKSRLHNVRIRQGRYLLDSGTPKI
jgi:hypothetical protein